MVRNRLSSVNKRINSILMYLDGKETRVVIQQVADEMDQVKSQSFSLCVDICVQAKASSQEINYDMTFADGSLRRIPLLTTTLPAPPIANKQRTGFSKEVFSLNGNPMAHFCGSTENVRSPDLSRADGPLIATSCSGLREERTLVCCFQILSTLSYSPPR